MTAIELQLLLRDAPLIASVQASAGSPVATPEALLLLAQASLREGVQLLRLEGKEAIRLIRDETRAPCIGLIKRSYEGSDVYITPTLVEVDELIALGCEIIALDGTRRPRPGVDLATLVARIHQAGRLAMADCDDIASVHYALASGCDLVGTTLAGYTPSAVATDGPDLEFLRAAVRESSAPVIAEGRYAAPAQAQVALRMGAAAVVVGGALNDPIKQTRAFLVATQRPEGNVGAVDIGGTWIRFSVFSRDGELLSSDQVATPLTREEREDWIRDHVADSGVARLGVSSGGTIEPRSGIVTEAKDIILGHTGSRFTEREFGVPTVALNDGLATAWGHACHPLYAGRRVATLALGTGVGCGFVSDHRIWMGRHGEYTRLNDLSPLPGKSFEDLLGGAALTADPSFEDQQLAQLAAVKAVRILEAMYMPDVIVLCGGVGLSDWLGLGELSLVQQSPYGAQAGLYGAAALALYAPW